MRTLARALVPLSVLVLVLLAPIEIDWHVRSALAIATGMVLCWLFDVLHPAIVGFLGCFLFRATGAVDFETAFAGFGTETPWFLYGALLLVGAADRSGVIGWLRARAPAVSNGSLLPPAVALIALAYALAFAIPSSLARATILVILAAAWASDPRNFRTSEPRNAGTEERRNAGTQEPRNFGILVLVAGYGAAAFGHPELPGGPLSIIGWDVAAAMAMVAGVVLVARARASAADVSAPRQATTPLEGMDVRIAAPVALAIVLWVTTPVHGISPALVGLGCGLLCCLPGIAPSNESPALKVDHLAVVFAGTAMSIPAVLVETRAADALTGLWSNATTIPAILPQNVVAYWATAGYRVFSPDGARPMLPSLDGPLGSAAIWAYAGSTLFSLHQSPALILAMSAGGCRSRQVLTIGLLVIILGSAVVMLF